MIHINLFGLSLAAFLWGTIVMFLRSSQEGGGSGCGEKSRRKGGILLNVFSLRPSGDERRRNSTLAAKWLSRPPSTTPKNRATPWSLHAAKIQVVGGA